MGRKPGGGLLKVDLESSLTQNSLGDQRDRHHQSKSVDTTCEDGQGDIIENEGDYEEKRRNRNRMEIEIEIEIEI